MIMSDIPLVEEEFWRAIPSLPKYEVSNLGRVRHKLKKKTVRINRDKYGHLLFMARIRDYYSTRRVSRCVGEAFGQLKNSGDPTWRVRYRDGNPENCRPSNLEWETAAEVWQRTRKEKLNAQRTDT